MSVLGGCCGCYTATCERSQWAVLRSNSPCFDVGPVVAESRWRSPTGSLPRLVRHFFRVISTWIGLHICTMRQRIHASRWTSRLSSCVLGRVVEATTSGPRFELVAVGDDGTGDPFCFMRSAPGIYYWSVLAPRQPCSHQVCLSSRTPGQEEVFPAHLRGVAAAVLGLLPPSGGRS
jgi:hypothetical protein